MEKLLTVKEIAEFFRVSNATIYKWKARDLIPYHRVNARLRFDKNEVKEWMQNRRKKKAQFLEKILQIEHRNLQSRLTNLPPLYIDKAGGNMATSTKGRRNFAYGSVYPRRDGGKYTVDFRTSSGKRIQRVVDAWTWQDANECLTREIRKEELKGRGIEIEREPIRVDEATDLYIEDYAKSNKKSWKDDEYRINAHIRPFFGNCRVCDITPLTIEKYRTWRLKSGVTKTTVNKECALLRKIINLMIDWGFANENPMSKIRPFSEKGTERERILSQEEEDRLLSECPSYLKPIIMTALHSGMRRGEIFNLKWDLIDFDRRIIKVEKTKNGKTRMIPINDRLYHELLKVKDQNCQNSYVFPNPETGKPYTEVKKSFKGACRRAGISSDLRFHDLRHGFATKLIQSNVDIITVRDLLGHSSVRITQRYTHSNQEQMRKAVELLAK